MGLVVVTNNTHRHTRSTSAWCLGIVTGYGILLTCVGGFLFVDDTCVRVCVCVVYWGVCARACACVCVLFFLAIFCIFVQDKVTAFACY